MKKEKGTLLFLVSGGMELSWLYAWAIFLTISTLHQPFPFPEAIGTFALAAVLTLFSKGKGWRIVYIIGLQVFGFILAALRIVYVFNPWSYSFWDQTWLIDFYNSPRNPLEWLFLFFLLFWAIMFWAGGVTLARRSMAYTTICSRFDLGIAAFFLLFLTKFLLLVKGGIKIEESISQLSVFPFFIFSLLAIGLVRNRSTAPRDFLPGYQGIGVILSFTVVVLLLGTGLVLFFLPYLTWASEVGYAILKTAAKPLGPILVSVIRFLFIMSGTIHPEKPSPPTKGGIGDLVSPSESSWWTELLEKILGWGLGTIFGLTVLIIFSLAIFYLFRWLFSRTPISQRRKSSWYLISWWAKRLQLFLLSLWRFMVRRVKGYKGAIQIYTALLSWGHRSGLPHFLSETPTEYGFRLKYQFPSLKREIGLIIEAFNQEVYGEIVLGDEQLSTARIAWRRLRSPLHWPSRLKAWFRQPSHLSEAIQYQTLDKNLMF
jgi:hypothetical protein